MTSGYFTIRDIFCLGCAGKDAIGWTYVHWRRNRSMPKMPRSSSKRAASFCQNDCSPRRTGMIRDSNNLPSIIAEIQNTAKRRHFATFFAYESVFVLKIAASSGLVTPANSTFN
jgi:hypothetical protein